ncbi:MULTISPECIES: zinc ABC transporter substrate-binding protein AztC [Streptomyces]|uniref:Zinc ABC transporter substrate-binding protein n=1 Tax=Streptomyces odorifer TaxID=53450 RepID=A0A7Y6C7I4_9ACTN|nr:MULTISPECIES: zinc ABC transporter substrate-binding protein AztC [Streptomyces]MBL0776083.1 zinc ABC transporter substrate-binding protein [Streptomyces albidoflavus]NUV38064.1 zinc ABC transporter substrate-binding protein [Streptomyces sp. KAI-27]NUV46586.1 zinc ABC transporter substrate-binding protein [Streptomyces sp. CAI-78]MCQ9704954.1 zinc ABC transporter substrate-binding protein AztC [Streptomyces sp. BSP1]NUV28486.1 zinc ABC transporter substrate-binding protein [Streptomyces od
MTATRRAGNVSPLLVLPLLLCLLAAVTGCTAQQQHRPSVVVTTNILGDLTRNVVGDEAEVTVLMQPGADPHSFGVSAPQAAAMEQADLLVHNGLGLEENVLRHVEAARDSGVPTLAVGESVDPMTYTGGESAGQPDPHFWTDPVRVREAVRLLSDRVVRHVEGVDAAAVEKNAERYGEELDGLHDAMRDAFGSVPADRRRLVTNHHVFGYLADRYGFRVVGAVIPSGTTLASPSASDLDSLATAVKKAGVRAIFADSSQPDRLAQVLKRESGIDVDVVPLFSESLTPKGQGAATYLQMMRANTEAITEGLTSR